MKNAPVRDEANHEAHRQKNANLKQQLSIEVNRNWCMGVKIVSLEGQLGNMKSSEREHKRIPEACMSVVAGRKRNTCNGAKQMPTM